MNIPAPLPDELALGHLGRIYVLNGVEKSHRTAKQVHKYAQPARRTSGGMHYIETLASLVGQTCSHYLFHYSLLPFYRAVQVGETKSWIEDYGSLFGAKCSASRASVYGTRVCPRCIEEDVAFWGFSYWRRSHQLPGINWCHKHHCSLRKCHSDAPIRSLPQDVSASADAFDPAISTFAMQDPTIHRYSEICMEFLGRKHPLSTDQMVNCLQQRARKLQLRSRAGITGRHLHDMAMQQVNGEWLLAYFPDIFTKNSSSSLTRTYSSKTVAYSTTYYALALALLYGSLDEAFTDLNAVAELDIAFGADSFPPHRDEEETTPLQRATSNFLQGMPVSQACSESGVERGVFEGLLRSAARRALSERVHV